MAVCAVITAQPLASKGEDAYCEAIDMVDGRCEAVHLRKREDGEVKVIKPQMLIGYLLDMSVGSEDTPKGGHAADVAARAAIVPCGPRSDE